MPTATKKKPAAKPLVFGSPPPRTEAAQRADAIIQPASEIFARALGGCFVPSPEVIEALHDVLEVYGVDPDEQDTLRERIDELENERDVERDERERAERELAELKRELAAMTDERDELKDALGDIKEALNRR